MQMIRHIAALIYELSSYEKGKGKNILRSKTLWLNLIAVLSMFAGRYAGVELTTDEQGAILAAANILLRLISKEETGFIERPPSEVNTDLLGRTHDE